MAEPASQTHVSREFALWRYPWNVSSDFERTKKAYEEIKRIGEKARRKFGNNFVGIQVFGSRAKGYATPESDLEFKIIFRQTGPDYDKFLKTSNQLREEIWNAIGRSGIDLGSNFVVTLDEIKRDIKQNPAHGLDRRAHDIADLFTGAWISAPGKETAQKEFVAWLRRRPDKKRIWKAADVFARGYLANVHDAEDRFNLRGEDMERINRAREQLRMPRLSRLEQRYSGKKPASVRRLVPHAGGRQLILRLRRRQ